MMTEQAMAEALADCMSEKIKYRKRAWHAESQLEVRYGLRQAINTALGLTDETGDDALRKGLATIDAMKRELAAMTKRADEMERLKEQNADMFYRIERELADLKARLAWRPIDTAPKDGTRISILCNGNRVCSAQWQVVPFVGTGWFCCVPCCFGWAYGSDTFIRNKEDQPTNWQPLPEQPKEGAE